LNHWDAAFEARRAPKFRRAEQRQAHQARRGSERRHQPRHVEGLVHGGHALAAAVCHLDQQEE